MAQIASGYGGVTPALRAVVSRAAQISGVPFGMYPSGGARTREEQTALQKAGWSKTSEGVHLDGRGIDLIPVINGQPAPNDKEAYAVINAAMKQASQELGVPVAWGGSWKSFPDLPHYQVSPQVAVSFKADPNATYTAPQSLDFGPAEAYELGHAGYPGVTAPTESELFSSLEQRYNLPSGYLTGSYGIESNYGKNLNVSSAGARGPFQFIPSTARQYGLANPNSLAASADAAARYAADNAQRLQAVLGREPTANELYLAHQQGVEGAISLLTNPDQPAASVVGYQRIAQNLPNGMRAQAASMTAGDFAKYWSGQFDQRAAAIGAPAEAGIRPVADATPAALGFGGVPVGMVADTQAAPVSQDIPAGPYGADKVVTAMQNGDVAGATKALNDLKVNAALSFNPFTNGIDKIKTDVTNYFKSQLPVVQAAFTKYPALTKAVPADMRPAVDAAQKVMPVADTAAVQPVSFPKTSAGAWGVKPQDTGWTYEPADQSATDATKSIYDTLASNDQAAQSANRMNAWSSFTDRPFEAPKSISPTEYAGGGNFFSSKPKTDTGVSAWSNAGAGQGFGLGTLQPSTPYPKTDALAGRDPLTGALAQADKAKTFLGGPMAGATLASALATPPASAEAEGALPIAGVSFLAPPVAAVPALKTAIAKPAVKAPATPVRYGSTGGAGVAPRSGGISAFGLSPSVLSAITAAKNAGYTTGIASPGYTSTSGYQNAMANGYTAPNFSKGSGGAIYAYQPNGQGGGTYVNSFGQTMTY